MGRCAAFALVLLLGFGLPSCELTAEAERGDNETMVVCTITIPSGWWGLLRSE